MATKSQTITKRTAFTNMVGIRCPCGHWEMAHTEERATRAMETHLITRHRLPAVHSQPFSFTHDISGNLIQQDGH